MKIQARIREILKGLLENMQKQRKVIMILSCFVVFTTTYLLILPAFTLDKDEAADQGGIDVPGIEQSAADETAQADVAADGRERSEAKKSAASQNTSKANENSKAKTEDSSTVTLQNDESDDLVVAVEGKDAGLSEDMNVSVREIDQSDKDQKEEYDSLYNDALEAV